MDLDVELAGIREGDETAFGRWLAGAELPVRSSLRTFAASVDTEAVVQETFLRIWQAAPRFQPDGRPNALVRLAIRIARNLALSELRRPAAQAGGIEGLDLDDIPGAGPAPPDPLLRKRIRECIERLARQPRAALLARLRSGGSLPDRRLAEQVGMRLNTFLQNVRRARNLMAACLRAAGVELS